MKKILFCSAVAPCPSKPWRRREAEAVAETLSLRIKNQLIKIRRRGSVEKEFGYCSTAPASKQKTLLGFLFACGGSRTSFPKGLPPEHHLRMVLGRKSGTLRSPLQRKKFIPKNGINFSQRG